MTDRHWDDEALSAYLDGELPAEDLARPRTPADEARLDELRASSEIIGSPVAPVPDEVREAMLRRALDQWATAPAPTADDLAARRERRGVRSLLDWRVLGPIAAAVLALVVAVPLLDDGGGGRQVAVQAVDEDVAKDEAAARTLSDSGLTSGGGAGGGSTAAPAPAVPDLGDVADTDELLARLQPFVGAPAGGDTAAAGPPPEEGAAESTDSAVISEYLRSGGGLPCTPATGPGLPELLVTLVARWQGTPAVVVVLRDPGGVVSAEVRAAESCQLLASAEVDTEAPR